MTAFEDLWREAKRYPIEEFQPFGLVNGQLWAPAYVKGKYRILTLDMSVARSAAWNVITMAGDKTNIVPLIRAGLAKSQN